MSKNITWIGIAALVVLIGVARFFVGGISPAPENFLGNIASVSVGESSVPSPAVSSSPPAATVGTEKDVTVTGANYSFTPSTLTVKQGDTVKITFKNVGGLHDLRIDEFNVATQRIRGGAEETVSFVADKAGTFEYYCSVGNHRAMGMRGTITVTE